MTDTVNLSKGEVVNLTKQAPALKKVFLGAGWDVKNGGPTMDADLCVFALNAAGQVRGKDDFIYYNHKKTSAGTIEHMGDNLTGAGDGDDEVVKINLEALDPEIQKIVVVLDIYQAQQKGQSLADLDNAFVRIVNDEGGAEISKFAIPGGLTGDTLFFGELNRTPEGWTFTATGATRTVNLGDLVAEYGLKAAA